MWDVTSSKCLQTLSGHNEAIYTVIQLKDGRVVSGSFDKTMKVREI